MPLVLRFAARSDVGRVRSKNDDSGYAGRHLAVVADGMGGHVGGDVASASTVLDLAALDQAGYVTPDTVLPDEIQNANLVLNDLVHANPKLAGMGTTCTAVLLAEDALHLAHIGDSRAYRLKDGAFEQVSRDHTFVQRLVDEGRLESTEAESHPHKNVLMRVLGDVDASPELDISALPAAAGERWVLCSDGLTSVVPPAEIEDRVRRASGLQEIVDELVQLTLAGGAPDNVTVVAFDVVEVSAEEAAEADHPLPSDEALAAASPGGFAPVSGMLLREALDTRPHALVGAADLATQTGKLPIVTRRTSERRAAALLTGAPTTGGQAERPTASHLIASTPDHPASELVGGTRRAEAGTTEDADDGGGPAGATGGGGEDDGDGGPGGREGRGRHRGPETRRRSWFLPVFATLLALLLLVILWWGYLWTQTQYYVGAHQGQVAIYNGVSQQLGPINLSHLDTVTEIEMDDLPDYNRQRIESGLPARDLEHAQTIVGQLEAALDEEPTPSPSPSPSPTESPAGTPGPTESPAGTPAPEARPGPDAATDPPGGDA